MLHFRAFMNAVSKSPHSGVPRLRVVLVLLVFFFGAQMTGATLARSSVLRADALHLLLDVLAVLLSLGAMELARRAPNDGFTFGFARAEPLAALINGLLVVFTAFEIVRHAISTWVEREPPEAGLMLLFAGVAVVLNGINAWILHGAIPHNHTHGHSHDHAHHDEAHRGHAHHDHDVRNACEGELHHEHEGDDELNLRSAKLHVLGDALGALAALVAALFIRLGAPTWVDPLASLFVAAILIFGAYRVLRPAVLVLLDAAPAALPTERVRAWLLAQDGVRGIEKLHVWGVGVREFAIVAAVRYDADARELGERLSKEFPVAHVVLEPRP